MARWRRRRGASAPAASSRWTTSLDDSWNDLALKPVYLPLVHQLVTLPGALRAAVGVAHGRPGRRSRPPLLKSRADRVVVTPSGERLKVPATEPGLLELNEQGVYEIRAASSGSAPPDRIAVNLDPAESDLTPLDPQELVAAVTGRARPTAAATAEAPAELTAEEAERRQGLWWYLLVAGLLLLAAEMVVSNHLSRNGTLSVAGRLEPASVDGRQISQRPLDRRR